MRLANGLDELVIYSNDAELSEMFRGAGTDAWTTIDASFLWREGNVNGRSWAQGSTSEVMSSARACGSNDDTAIDRSGGTGWAGRGSE